MSEEYATFLDRKSQLGGQHGFEPVWMPDFLFDFQKDLVSWAIRKGRAAIFADCGLGKTPMQLVWAENIVRKTGGHVLILTPLAVSHQTAKEGEKFGIECLRSQDGLPKGNISVTNYERLHLFSPTDFVGVVCDESSILKHFGGATQKLLTRFTAKMPYRLLCTATAAPNDYVELGTSSEALGYLGYSDMLSRFFNQEDSKRSRMNDVKAARTARHGDYYAKLAYRVSQTIGQWRLKAHAEVPFWRWICSWARACRMPSDLGFPDDGFILPDLSIREHIVCAKRPPSEWLFTVPAFGLQEERDERRRTLDERCEIVARLTNHHSPAVIWCHLNVEGDALAKSLGTVQVRGSDSDDQKEEAYRAFIDGSLRVLVIKPKIGAYGLNWQHCAHVVTFASHSYEQYYQAIRRCWRFGQTSNVMVDIISCEGEQHVRDNMKRKADAASKMFTQLVKHMNNPDLLKRDDYRAIVEVPSWLSQNKTLQTDTRSTLATV